MSLSTKEPHLACSLSVTVPAAVVANGGGGGDGGDGGGGGDGDLQATIGSDLRAGNRNRGLAARASHTPRVLPEPSPSSVSPRTRTPGTVGKRETRGPRDRLLERASSLRGIDESTATRAIPTRYSCRSLRRVEIDGRISVPFNFSPFFR